MREFAPGLDIAVGIGEHNVVRAPSVGDADEPMALKFLHGVVQGNVERGSEAEKFGVGGAVERPHQSKNPGAAVAQRFLNADFTHHGLFIS